jgi:choline-sulfatase
MRKLLAFALALLSGSGCRPAPKPDLVVILVDTLRRDHLPGYGYERPTAPFLSELARRGTVFENAYSTTSWTAPATAALFTSLYPLQHGLVTGRMAVERLTGKGVALKVNRIPSAAETMAEALQAGGYATWAVVENVNLSREMGFDQGFQEFHSLHPSLDAAAISKKLDELRPRILAKHPYFLYLHYMDVHAPYQEREPFSDSSLPQDARRIAAYDSDIHYLDEHLRASFASFGWDKGTTVVVTGDHGEELGERGFFGHARTLYAEVLNVPLFFYGGSAPAGRRVRERVSHIDVLPTLRALCGLPRAAGDAGVSLLPLIEGGRDTLPDRALFADLWRNPGGERRSVLRATIHGRWKRIGGNAEGPQLFDLEADPRELVNLAGAQPEVEASLKKRFAEFEAAAPKLTPEFAESLQDAGTNEELKALGYVN